MKHKLHIRPTPEYLRRLAHRDARDIVRFGWRPEPEHVARLRACTGDAVAYKVMLHAWHAAGFPLTAIKRIAGRI
jgi:hypothetical protein